jgi:S-adenosyl methyltransferase
VSGRGPEASRIDPPRVNPRIDTSVPHPARRYNYWLGGKDNFAVDRASADQIAEAFPTVPIAAVENRRFLRRAVTFLAEAGVRQFLDIGTGLPTADNTHEVAQAIAPDARIVYVDNDPLVLVHARALLTSSPEGATAYIDADLREPDKILSSPDLEGILDLSQPIGLMLVAILHFIVGADAPYEIVADLVAALPSGSCLVMSHVTYDLMPPEVVAKLNAIGAARNEPFQARSRAEFARFFDGLELVPPGIVSVAEWRADDEPSPRPSASDVCVYGAVARVVLDDEMHLPLSGGQ